MVSDMFAANFLSINTASWFLEQHCTAKVNLIAAEGPLEEDRMVVLHGFTLQVQDADSVGRFDM